MLFSTVFSVFSLATAASAVTVSYDTGYDMNSRQLSALSCSDGFNGLITKYGYKTLGQVAGFPNIGGAAAIAGWNSPSCGTCWQLTYKGKSINVLAVDHATTGFNLGQIAMNNLTGGQAAALGRVDATVTQVDVKKCGLSR